MGAVRDMWMRWKMLRLPWRRTFLIGQDLNGNTYWQFKDALNHNRFRRIVRYNRKTHHSDVQVSPQWHQWLRHTRPAPPTLQEQAADVQRQAQLKHNARLADERWARKAKYIESPKPAEEATHSVVQQDTTSQGKNHAAEPEDKASEMPTRAGPDWQLAAWVPGKR